MAISFLVLSILFCVIGHFFKVVRISQFIEIYEEPNDKVLLKALTFSNLINFVLPFRLGNLFRAIYPGKKMKNGISFSIATVIVDIIIDFVCVGFVFLGLLLLGKTELNNVLFYSIIISLICILLLLTNILNKYIKTIIYKIASVFNEKIELKILKTSWFTITSFKDLIMTIDKIKLLLISIIIWTFYILSYYLLSRCLILYGYNVSFIELFDSLFSSMGMASTIINWSGLIYNKYNIIILLYTLTPLIIVYCLSFVYKRKKTNVKYKEILPHVNTHNRLLFLEQYFSSTNRDYFKMYMKINSDASIIDDYSAGSNATTMLCSKDGKLFYRKYSFGEDATKLKEQIDWIRNHQKVLKLTKIIEEKNENGCCCYDMPYEKDAVTCFNYVHTSTIECSWKLLKQVLDDINKNLHSLNIRNADKNMIDEYIDKKVYSNIEKIENSNYIKPLIKYDEIIINGKKYKNLNKIKKMLDKEKLEKIFHNDICCDIHGDFTIENIICYYNQSKDKKYYIIDPNTGNLFDSKNLDYAKLLQSIHGGYEFLMNTKEVNIDENKINFLFTKSDKYNKLYDRYKKYLYSHFGDEQVKSIFYHEIVHWLRLMPYKIKKNGERSVLFYAGLIIVMNDVLEMFGEK